MKNKGVMGEELSPKTVKLKRFSKDLVASFSGAKNIEGCAYAEKEYENLFAGCYVRHCRLVSGGKIPCDLKKINLLIQSTVKKVFFM
ncbi:MAG: hypothetical protein ABI041_02755 [Bdellovibrionia bacterium]